MSTADIIVWDKGHGQPAIGESTQSTIGINLVFEKDYPVSRQFRRKANLSAVPLTMFGEFPESSQSLIMVLFFQKL